MFHQHRCPSCHVKRLCTFVKTEPQGKDETVLCLVHTSINALLPFWEQPPAWVYRLISLLIRLIPLFIWMRSQCSTTAALYISISLMGHHGAIRLNRSWHYRQHHRQEELIPGCVHCKDINLGHVAKHIKRYTYCEAGV